MPHERSYEVEYEDVSDVVVQDVSLSLTESQENALFTAIAHEVGLCLQNGNIPDQMLHLARRIEDQQSKHPPWFDVRGDERVYDLELTTWDSELLLYTLTQALLDPEVPTLDEDAYDDLIQQIESKTEYSVQ